VGLLVQSRLGTGEEEREPDGGERVSVEETTQWRDGERRRESV
jgi:hypothetical protein